MIHVASFDMILDWCSEFSAVKESIDLPGGVSCSINEVMNDQVYSFHELYLPF